MNVRFVTSAALAASLSGCSLGAGRSELRIPVATKLPDAALVLTAIKEDLANYNAYAAAHENDGALPNACKGSLSFRVKSVALSLVVINQASTSANAGAKVPIAGFQLGPSFSTSTAYKGSQKVNLLFVPTKSEEASVSISDTAAPNSFDAILRSTRTSLLQASGNKPCFTFPAEQKNSIEASFQVVTTNAASTAVSFLIFSAGAEAKGSSDITNTITINFEGMGQTVIDPNTGTPVQDTARLNGNVPPEDRRTVEAIIKAQKLDTISAPNSNINVTTKKKDRSRH